MAEISQEELNERVALLKKFRSLLEQQRSKFREYLNVLEKQQDSITEENPEALMAHTELEQQVVKNIVNLQKVIVPMTKLYHSKNPLQTSAETTEITKIQDELSDLQNKVLKQNEINRDLLRIHMEQLKTRLANMKNPYKNTHSIYAKNQGVHVATMVRVEV